MKNRLAIHFTFVALILMSAYVGIFCYGLFPIMVTWSIATISTCLASMIVIELEHMKSNS